jgi:hypothetical protein
VRIRSDLNGVETCALFSVTRGSPGPAQGSESSGRQTNRSRSGVRCRGFAVYNDDPNRAAVEVRAGIFVQLKGCSVYSKGPGIVADSGASVSLDGCLVWIMNPDKYGALASQGIVSYNPNYFVVDHTWINGASIGVYVYDDRPQTSAWVVIWLELRNNTVGVNGLGGARNDQQLLVPRG